MSSLLGPDLSQAVNSQVPSGHGGADADIAGLQNREVLIGAGKTPAGTTYVELRSDAVVGLSVALMHYTGMAAYHVSGPVEWSAGYAFRWPVGPISYAMSTVRSRTDIGNRMP